MIITGTGHCGTGWAAAVLNKAGVKCGHESVYDFNEQSWTPDRWNGYDAEASWAAPVYNLRHYRVLHLIRDPVEWVQSMWMRGWWADQCECRDDAGRLKHGYRDHFGAPYPRMIDRHLGDTISGRPTHAERLAAHWLHWNDYIVDRTAYSWRRTVNVGSLWSDTARAVESFNWLVGKPVVTAAHVESVGVVNRHRDPLMQVPADVVDEMRDPYLQSVFATMPTV